MAAGAVSIGLRVEGMSALLRAMGSVTPEAAKNLKATLKTVGTRLATETAAKVPKRTGRAAGSLTARLSGNDVLVTGGGSKAQYYAWLDFGGTVGRGRRSTTTVTLYTTKTGKVRLRRGATTRAGKTGTAVRPFIKGGRYLYPTFSRMRTRLRADMEQALADGCRNAGLAVTR